MFDNLVFGIVFISSIYLIARLMNYAAYMKILRESQEKERARLQRVAELYGREYRDYPSRDEEL